jgi:hypothetical protein
MEIKLKGTAQLVKGINKVLKYVHTLLCQSRMYQQFEFEHFSLKCAIDLTIIMNGLYFYFEL